MRARLTALAAIVMVVLTGCLSLPTEGGVQVGQDSPPADGGLEVVAPGPSEDATPEAIVQGFLLASSFGLGDDFARAREFLTTAGGAQWNPLGGVTVYSDIDQLEVIVEEAEPDEVGLRVTVRAAVTATVAIDGTYTEVAPGAPQEFAFRLVQIADDQWRISQLDAGVLMSEVTFGTQYREVPIYFLSGEDVPRLVPDLRWLPRSRTVTGSVRALLGGAADWLTSPAVVTAFPSGTELAAEGVTVDDRLATVALTSEFLAAGAVDRAYARAQLSETLRQLGQVNRVQISVDGNVLQIDEMLAAVATTPVPVRGPYLVTADGLALLSGGASSVLDAYVMPPGISALAVPYSSGPMIGLVEGRALVAMSEDGSEPATLLPTEVDLLAPSYDVHGWVWTGPTGEGSNQGMLTAVDPVTGTIGEVTATDLTSTDVVALRVSREGTRLAYAVQTDTAVIVYVAAIQRDTSGRPVAVAPGQPIGTPFASVNDLVWVDDVEVAVLASESDAAPPTVLLLGVGGQTAPLPSVEGAVAIASGDGRRELFLVTSEGDLYGRSGNGWRRVGQEEVAAPAFAG